MKGYRDKIVVVMMLMAFVLLCQPMGSAYASAYQDWSGIWVTNQGEIKLSQDNKKVVGTFPVNREIEGRLEGILEDEWGWILKGKFFTGIDAGTFEIRMVESNARFQGWIGSPDSVWTGHRLNALYSKTRQQEMTILNNSPYHITALFICPTGSEEWQEVLEGRELRLGQQRNVTFTLDSNVSNWDIKVVDSSGHFTVFQNQELKQDFTSINYYYKNSSGHIRFAVG